MPTAPDPDEAEDEAESQPSVSQTIGVIPIGGIIAKHCSQLETECGACDLEDIAEQLKAFRADASVSAILLTFDSPGGTITGVPEVAQLISDIDAVKPVYAFCGDQCCSAAYWLASQARGIIVSPSSAIGSVGCYIYLEDHSKEYEMDGIKPEPIVSAGSSLKLAGADFKPLTDAERAMFQADVDKIYSQFTAAIAAKRTVQPEYLKGQVVDGETAVNVGLADGLANDIEGVITLLAQG